MDGRLKTSKKWSPLPPDVKKAAFNIIHLHFSEKHPGKAQDGEFILEGKIFPEELCVRVGYIDTGAITQNNFETSISYSPGKTQVLEQFQILLEASTSLMDSFFDSPETEFPREWSSYDWNGDEIHIRHSRVNSNLEAQADELLGESVDEGIFNQTPEAEMDEMMQRMGLSEKTEDSPKPPLH